MFQFLVTRCMMQTLSGYSMLASTVTMLMLSTIFLSLSYQSDKTYMRLWGSSWMIYAAIFFLDFVNLFSPMQEVVYIMFRQMIALLGSYLFLLGTFRFFQMRFPAFINMVVVFFAAVFLAAGFFAADFFAVFFAGSAAAGSPAGSPSVPSAAVFFL